MPEKKGDVTGESVHAPIQINSTYVQMVRRSDGLSTSPDDQNTVTRQYTNTNNAPRDPLPFPVTRFLTREVDFYVNIQEGIFALSLMSVTNKHLRYLFQKGV